jgi:hypothetical protein
VEEKNIYQICDSIITKSKDSEFNISPSSMGFSHKPIHKAAIDLLVSEGFIQFVNGKTKMNHKFYLTAKG